jgi:cytochrome b subunit of formate dehydrogenase
MASHAPATPLAAAATGAAPVPKYYKRFGRIERALHALLMITFIGCTITGLPPLFSDHDWAASLANMLGGFRSSAIVHRVCAFVMIAVFVSHVAMVFYRAVTRHGLLGTLWGPNSMTPQPQDILDMWNHVKWFVGIGPRPQFDRWTYWEKFDYWAVFWGMFIIGGSGLMLTFPQEFAEVLPGWVFNVATVLHGEEALLAVGFIFTIHFFNGHIRPEKFPMDLVIFTGRISEHELKEERRTEYERLVKEGRLKEAESTPPSPAAALFGYVVGGTAVIVGTVTIFVIVYSVIL